MFEMTRTLSPSRPLPNPSPHTNPNQSIMSFLGKQTDPCAEHIGQTSVFLKQGERVLQANTWYFCVHVSLSQSCFSLVVVLP